MDPSQAVLHPCTRWDDTRRLASSRMQESRVDPAVTSSCVLLRVSTGARPVVPDQLLQALPAMAIQKCPPAAGRYPPSNLVPLGRHNSRGTGHNGVDVNPPSACVPPTRSAVQAIFRRAMKAAAHAFR